MCYFFLPNNSSIDKFLYTLESANKSVTLSDDLEPS